VLKRNLKVLLEKTVWDIPTAAVITEGGIAALVQWRPTTSDGVRKVCGDAIDESAVDSVAKIISDHQNEMGKGAKKKKKRLTREKEDEEEGQSVKASRCDQPEKDNQKKVQKVNL
jgi:hypothetical protein